MFKETTIFHFSHCHFVTTNFYHYSQTMLVNFPVAPHLFHNAVYQSAMHCISTLQTFNTHSNQYSLGTQETMVKTPQFSETNPDNATFQLKLSTFLCVVDFFQLLWSFAWQRFSGINLPLLLSNEYISGWMFRRFKVSVSLTCKAFEVRIRVESNPPCRKKFYLRITILLK